MNRTEILSRLIKADQITFEEALFLMEKEKEYVYYPYYYTPQPLLTSPPYTITTYGTLTTGTLPYTQSSN